MHRSLAIQHVSMSFFGIFRQLDGVPVTIRANELGIFHGIALYSDNYYTFACKPVTRQQDHGKPFDPSQKVFLLCITGLGR